MQSHSINNYISLGASLRFVEDSKAGMAANKDHWIGPAIDRAVRDLERFGLPVTHRASNKLVQLRAQIKEKGPDHLLTADEAKQLSDAVTRLRETLRAEADGNLAYVITEKRLDVRKLTSRVSDLFRPGVFASLDDVARHDFDEAGKCIAFERATAAAFHLLRGTEGVLRHFYAKKVKRNRVDPLLWAPIVGHLRRIRRPPATELLDNLDNIRKSFRNPTQHPEKVYDIHEVQDLFGLCVDVVNRMQA